MKGAFKDFDIDLKFGQEGENWLKLLADEKTMEVKRERDIWATSGNVCFEFRCNGVPSGVAATKAKWWVHILSLNGEAKSVLLFEVEHLKARLRHLIQTKQISIIKGGDGARAEMALVPLNQIHQLIK